VPEMLSFHDISDLSHAPDNLLPAGLSALLAPPGAGRSRVIYQQQAAGQTGALAVGSLPEPLLTLMEQDRLGAALTAMGADPAAGVVLAGEDAAATAGASFAPEVWPAARTDMVPPDNVEEIGIIDAGIAFWNPAFQDSRGVSRFASFGGLTLKSGELLAGETLDPAVLTAMVARGHTSAGDRENRQQLAALLPSSVYAPVAYGRPLFPPNAMAHGTAMTELVLSTASDTARLHGLELPQDVVRDLSGGMMGGVMNGAVRALVDQVVACRSDGNPFRMVLLLAFGFLGGPQEGMAAEHQLVEQLNATLASYRNLGIEVQLVVPMGNHLQDQAHATLPADRKLGWRIQPDDHSLNTLEVIHPGPVAKIKLIAPDGSKVKLKRSRKALGVLKHGGKAIGAVWHQEVGGGLLRTRISLNPSATRQSGLAAAPFGLWQIKLPKGPEAEVWILRDEMGFDANPATPSRRSWLEDGARPLRDPNGMPFLDDSAAPAGALVLRAGSGSLLAAHSAPQITSVGAQWQMAAGGAKQCWYSGNALDGTAPERWEDLAAGADPAHRPIGPFGWRAVLGNGGQQRYRAAGTSLAAALAAGSMA